MKKFNFSLTRRTQKNKILEANEKKKCVKKHVKKNVWIFCITALVFWNCCETEKRNKKQTIWQQKNPGGNSLEKKNQEPSNSFAKISAPDA